MSTQHQQGEEAATEGTTSQRVPSSLNETCLPVSSTTSASSSEGGATASNLNTSASASTSTSAIGCNTCEEALVANASRTAQDGASQQPQQQQMQLQSQQIQQQQQQQQTQQLEVKSEEDGYWKKVTDNPNDFSSWQYLVSLADRSKDIAQIRKAYDGFLDHFPLCYMYWQKYSETELEHTGLEAAISIYERAVKAVPNSIDLWTHYCQHMVENSEMEKARIVFERAAKVIGEHFASHSFWDKYIEFETSLQDYPRVMELYLKIITTPLDQLQRYWERFKSFATIRPLQELLSPVEMQDWEQRQKENEKLKIEASCTIELPSESQFSEALPSKILSDEEIEKAVKDKALGGWEAKYKMALEEANARRDFETIVMKRAFFHIKAVPESMLDIWRKYLDFEELSGKHSRIIVLYERCLITCFYYSEFWLRYACWLEKYVSIEAARDVLARASTYLTKRPEIGLLYAQMEEMLNNESKARSILSSLIDQVPGHLETTLQAAAFAYRHNTTKEVCNIYELGLQAVDSASYSFLAIQYSFFASREIGLDRAREILQQAIHKCGECKSLWLAAIHFELYQTGPDRYERVKKLFTQALEQNSPLNQTDQEEIAQMYTDFMLMWCRNIREYRSVIQTCRRPSPHPAPQTNDSSQNSLPTTKHEPQKRPAEITTDTTSSQSAQQIPLTGQEGADLISISQPPAKHLRTALLPVIPATPVLPTGLASNPYAMYGNVVGTYGATQPFGYQWPTAMGGSFPYAYAPASNPQTATPTAAPTWDYSQMFSGRS
ncbi:Pre-mRNA-processing factor 39 [Pelomyxa schiedti]|nr:Pre-mRNA-processing factor 39 [Pelomyxa schiedti]